MKSKPDCLIIAGTSLKIPGVRKLVRELARAVHAAKGCVIWMNTDEPSISIVDFVEYIDMIVVGDCQDIPKVVDSYEESLKKKPRTKVKKEESDKSSKPMKSPKKQSCVTKPNPQTKKSKSKKDTKIQSRLEELVTKINEAK